MEQNIKLKTEEGAILTIQMKDGVDSGNNTGWNFISTANTTNFFNFI